MNIPTTFTDAQVPSHREIKARTNLVFQMWRFVVLNVKMLLMVIKGHH